MEEWGFSSIFVKFVTSGCSCRLNFSWFVCGYTAHVWSLLDKQRHIEQLCDALIHGYATWYFKWYCTLPIPTFYMIAGHYWDSFGWDHDVPAFRLSCLQRKHLQPTADALSWGPTTTLLTAHPGCRTHLSSGSRTGVRAAGRKLRAGLETLFPLLLFNDTYKKRDVQTWDGASSGSGHPQSFGWPKSYCFVLEPGWQASTPLFLWDRSQAQF